MALLSSVASAAQSASNHASSVLSSNNVLDPILGSGEHAIITVYDYRQKMENTQNSGAVGGTTDLTKSLLGKAGSVLPKAPALPTGPDEKRYTVQFNPSTMRFNTHNEQVVHGGVTGNEKPNTSSSSTQTPSVELHVELLLDAVQNTIAFIGDKFTTVASTQAIKNVSASILNSVKGDDTPYTVKPVTEAFIAALRNPSTRKVCFSWRNFHFKGILKNANAEYTMFSPAGRPIRAKLTLRIRQEGTEGNQAWWVNAFEEAFQDNGSLSLSKFF